MNVQENIKPLLLLKLKILEAYGRQYVAARALEIRDDELSAILSGRKRPSEYLIQKFEQVLQCNRRSLGL
ncbi:MAG: hypothetical protein A2583_13625 [Bdellovibrionales bacterium RIFOXYD1_FULL_53_11]|nr:MAG: hypothetical protein A2583_13625 [Bdellovibrionales bacterium RIFOXYD1_FULL_53_11]